MVKFQRFSECDAACKAKFNVSSQFYFTLFVGCCQQVYKKLKEAEFIQQQNDIWSKSWTKF